MKICPNPMELNKLFNQVSSLQTRLQSESEEFLRIRQCIGEMMGSIQSEDVTAYMRVMETAAQDVHKYSAVCEQLAKWFQYMCDVYCPPLEHPLHNFTDHFK